MRVCAHSSGAGPVRSAAVAAAAAAVMAWACGQPAAPGPGVVGADRVTIAPSPDARKPPFEFPIQDALLLDEIQRGAFNYLWAVCSPETGMVYDRTSVRFVSVAGVGFQLAALPVGVERGWITREEGEARARTILRALADNPGNRKAGLFYHYLDGQTAGPERSGPELVVSTIDSAILLAGVAVAASYFGGETGAIGDRLIDGADWSFFVSGDEAKAHERGFISLGWKPADPAHPVGEGSLLPYYWLDSGDEHRLVVFMANTPSDPARRVPPEMYYRLRRALGAYGDTGPMAWFPWSGALFTAFFAHCFIDYAGMGVDDPASFGVERRARVDWWENSRRHVRLHQIKAVENPLGLPTLGENAWGLTASDSPAGYAVPGVFPDPLPMPGSIPEFDFATVAAEDRFGDGTIAPYAAVGAMLFDPGRALAALRHYRSLKGADEGPLVWRDPTDGGFGFRDALNLSGPGGTPWAAADCVAIDQGPIVLCLENARSGRVWSWFHAHEACTRAMSRLGMVRYRKTE